MKKKVTEVVFILDRSGSMGGLESDTIGGFNSLINKQKEEDGKAYVTTVLFDDMYEVIHNRTNLKKIPKMTQKDYYVRGTTALLDSIGKTIKLVSETQKIISEKSDNVMFVIITDGMENASQEYTQEKIKKIIEKKKSKHGWEFVFLGANIDAVKTARNIGISKDRAANYHADSEGINVSYAAVSETVKSYRSGKKIDDEWKENIESDYVERNN